MNKQQTQADIARFEALLQEAHNLGTQLRNQFLELDVTRVEDQDKKTGMCWRIASCCEHITTAQTYAQKFGHFVNNHLKGEEV